MSNLTPIPVKTTLIAALLCAVSLLLSCAHAQQSEADRLALAQLRAKAEQGDLQSQFELGLAFYWGKYGEAEDKNMPSAMQTGMAKGLPVGTRRANWAQPIIK
jgi:TPR repeat protein